MAQYNVNDITSSPHYPQSNGLAEKYVQIGKNLFQKAQDLYQCLMVYHNTPLSSTLQSAMQILTSRAGRSSLPMSNGAMRQNGLDCKELRAHCKNEYLPTHDFHIGQSVVYLNPVDRRWYPATITSICKEPQSYKIKTEDGTTYRKTQNHLKLYQRCTDKMNINDTRTKRSNNISNIRPKCKVNPPIKLDL